MAMLRALDFPGAVTQGFDLPDARLMIASALEDLAEVLLEEGKPLPVPPADVHGPEADLIETVPLSVHAGRAERSGMNCRTTCTGTGVLFSEKVAAIRSSRTRRRVPKLRCRDIRACDL
jgi:predicted RNase H-like HicB family nuclease